MKENQKSKMMAFIEEQIGKRFMSKQEAEQLKKAELKSAERLEVEEKLKRARFKALL